MKSWIVVPKLLSRVHANFKFMSATVHSFLNSVTYLLQYPMINHSLFESANQKHKTQLLKLQKWGKRATLNIFTQTEPTYLTPLCKLIDTFVDSISEKARRGAWLGFRPTFWQPLPRERHRDKRRDSRGMIRDLPRHRAPFPPPPPPNPCLSPFLCFSTQLRFPT